MSQKFTTKKAKPYEFEVDGEVFRCVPTVPANAIFGIGLAGDSSMATQMRAAMDFLDMVLDSESCERFAKRMKSKGGVEVIPIPRNKGVPRLGPDGEPLLDDNGNPLIDSVPDLDENGNQIMDDLEVVQPDPIDFETVLDIQRHLTEVFASGGQGGPSRPTGGPTGSPNGSGPPGRSSTVSAR